MMENIRHIGVYVDDLEGMKQFYCNNFAFAVKVHDIEKSLYIDRVLGLQNSSVELYKLELSGGGMLELLKYTQDKNVLKDCRETVWKKGNAHIAITVDDVVRLYEKLCRQSIRFISEPVMSSDGKAKVCFCQDPEGNYLELVEEL